MLAVLAAGFAMGLSHALEADHVAAVASLVSSKTDLRQIARHGAVWGFGHSITLLAVGGVAVLLGKSLAPRLAVGFELVVGLMLLVLGCSVLWQVLRKRRAAESHHESHLGDRSWLRTLAVGGVHGLAGTSALVLLVAAAQTTPLMGLAYLALFGLGSIVGMALLSTLIALPISYTARSLASANRCLRGLIGVATIGIGCTIVARTSALL